MAIAFTFCTNAFEPLNLIFQPIRYALIDAEKSKYGSQGLASFCYSHPSSLCVLHMSAAVTLHRIRIGVVPWNVILLSSRIILQMKNVFQPRSVSDTDLCTRTAHHTSHIRYPGSNVPLFSLLSNLYACVQILRLVLRSFT